MALQCFLAVDLARPPVGDKPPQLINQDRAGLWTQLIKVSPKQWLKGYLTLPQQKAPVTEAPITLSQWLAYLTS